MSFFEYTADGHLVAEHNGRKAIDTRTPMLNLVPAATITKTGFSISWPDLWKGTLYHQYRDNQTQGFDIQGCSTWIGLVGQEWGPNEPAPNTLPDIDLGSVPAGTDYLEVWVYLSRTVAPANIADLPILSAFPEDQWVKLDGHSCVIEEFGGVARQFEFVIDGTTVKLRRLQSVTETGGIFGPAPLRQTGGSTLGNKVFFFPGTNAPQSGTYATYGQKIDEKATANGQSHRPAGYENGSSMNTPCSMSHAGISYASTWSGHIIIKPGRISA